MPEEIEVDLGHDESVARPILLTLLAEQLELLLSVTEVNRDVSRSLSRSLRRVKALLDSVQESGG